MEADGFWVTSSTASPRKDQGLRGQVWVVRESRRSAGFEMAEKHTPAGAVCLARNLEQRSGKEQINVEEL